MQFKNICTKQVYTDKQGNQKTNWLMAGTLKVLNDGKMFIQLNHLPDVTFFVFEQRKKEESSPAQSGEPVDENWSE